MTDPTNTAEPVTPPADEPVPSPDLDALREEVRDEQPDGGKAERDAGIPPNAVKVMLRDHEFVVLHPIDWPGSANEFYIQNRFYAWAMKALAFDADKRVWDAMDPSTREGLEFGAAVMAATGATPGESIASQILSGGMRGA